MFHVIILVILILSFAILMPIILKALRLAETAMFGLKMAKLHFIIVMAIMIADLIYHAIS